MERQRRDGERAMMLSSNDDQFVSSRTMVNGAAMVVESEEEEEQLTRRRRRQRQPSFGNHVSSFPYCNTEGIYPDPYQHQLDAEEMLMHRHQEQMIARAATRGVLQSSSRMMMLDANNNTTTTTTTNNNNNEEEVMQDSPSPPALRAARSSSRRQLRAPCPPPDSPKTRRAPPSVTSSSCANPLRVPQFIEVQDETGSIQESILTMEAGLMQRGQSSTSLGMQAVVKKSLQQDEEEEESPLPPLEYEVLDDPVNSASPQHNNDPPKQDDAADIREGSTLKPPPQERGRQRRRSTVITSNKKNKVEKEDYLDRKPPADAGKKKKKRKTPTKEKVNHSYHEAMIAAAAANRSREKNQRVANDGQPTRLSTATTATITKVEQGPMALSKQGQKSSVSHRLAKGVRKRLGFGVGARKKQGQVQQQQPLRRPNETANARATTTGAPRQQRPRAVTPPREQREAASVTTAASSANDAILFRLQIDQIKEIFPDAPDARILSLLQQGHSVRTAVVVLAEESFTFTEQDLGVENSEAGAQDEDDDDDEEEQAEDNEHATAPTVEETRPSAASSPVSAFASLPTMEQDEMLEQVMEIFPEADVDRVNELIEQERSLNIVLQILAEESMEMQVGVGDVVSNTDRRAPRPPAAVAA